MKKKFLSNPQVRAAMTVFGLLFAGYFYVRISFIYTSLTSVSDLFFTNQTIEFFKNLFWGFLFMTYINFFFKDLIDKNKNWYIFIIFLDMFLLFVFTFNIYEEKYYFETPRLGCRYLNICKTENLEYKDDKYAIYITAHPRMTYFEKIDYRWKLMTPKKSYIEQRIDTIKTEKYSIDYYSIADKYFVYIRLSEDSKITKDNDKFQILSITGSDYKAHNNFGIMIDDLKKFEIEINSELVKYEPQNKNNE